MKIFAHFDSEGTIRALVWINAPEGVGLMLAPEPGTFVAEIEGLKFKSDKPDLEELREIARSHKVSTPLPRCKLEKKR